MADEVLTLFKTNTIADVFYRPCMLIKTIDELEDVKLVESSSVEVAADGVATMVSKTCVGYIFKSSCLVWQAPDSNKQHMVAYEEFQYRCGELVATLDLEGVACDRDSGRERPHVRTSWYTDAEELEDDGVIVVYEPLDLDVTVPKLFGAMKDASEGVLQKALEDKENVTSTADILTYRTDSVNVCGLTGNDDGVFSLVGASRVSVNFTVVCGCGCSYDWVGDDGGSSHRDCGKWYTAPGMVDSDSCSGLSLTSGVGLMFFPTVSPGAEVKIPYRTEIKANKLSIPKSGAWVVKESSTVKEDWYEFKDAIVTTKQTLEGPGYDTKVEGYKIVAPPVYRLGSWSNTVANGSELSLVKDNCVITCFTVEKDEVELNHGTSAVVNGYMTIKVPESRAIVFKTCAKPIVDVITSAMGKVSEYPSYYGGSEACKTTIEYTNIEPSKDWAGLAGGELTEMCFRAYVGFSMDITEKVYLEFGRAVFVPIS